MIKVENYFKYCKLFKFNCYSNVHLKQRKLQKNFCLRGFFINNSYHLYYNFFFYMFLVQKLRLIIRNIISNKGKLVFINEFFDIFFFLKKLISINNQFYFNFHKGLFSSIMLVKNFLKKDNDCFKLFNYGFLQDFNINFVILFLNQNFYFDEQLVFFRQVNMPILYFFETDKFFGDYHLSVCQNNRSVYFWTFLILRLVWEENFFYLQKSTWAKVFQRIQNSNQKISFSVK